MKTISDIKQYHLTTEEIETMLQTQYGSKIQPVDQGKLRKLRIQLQRQASAGIVVNDKSIELAEELREKELESMDDIINEPLYTG